MTGIPYTTEEGALVLAGASVLLIVVLLISVWKKMGIGREFVVGLLMGGAQLFGIAVLLTFLFRFDDDVRIWFPPVIVLIGLMAVIGGRRSAKRASGMPGAVRITTPAIIAGAAVSLTVLALSRAMPLKPQFIVPLAGMAFGNSMTICSLALDRLVREFEMNRAAIETRLSLGASSKQAMEDLSRRCVRAALIPTIDRLKTLGIIFIPGAMAGLLIAGTDPLVAAEYQLIVYLMIVGGGIVTSLIVAVLSRSRFFNENEQVRDWI